MGDAEQFPNWKLHTAGERMTLHTLRDSARKLQESNGEAHCVEHKAATVQVLYGLADCLSDLSGLKVSMALLTEQVHKFQNSINAVAVKELEIESNGGAVTVSAKGNRFSGPAWALAILGLCVVAETIIIKWG